MAAPGNEVANADRSLVEQLRARRTQMMLLELEAVALRLFEQRGFSDVTVEEISAAAQISPRTFYRYFPTKDDVFQVRIAQRSEALAALLATRPLDESPLHSLRAALVDVLAVEDVELLRRWITVVASTPTVVKSVLGGIALNMQVTMTEFVGGRLDSGAHDLAPTMLAAAVGGVVQAAQTRWFFEGGDLATVMSKSLDVLEQGLAANSTTWTARPSTPRRGRSPRERRSPAHPENAS